jgi:hypothetical protein
MPAHTPDAIDRAVSQLSKKRQLSWTLVSPNQNNTIARMDD